MFNPITANDTDVTVPPVTGDSAAAVIVVVPLKSEVVPYSNDTVVEARFAFTVPDNDTVVVPIDDAVVPLTVGTAGAAYVYPPATVKFPPDPVKITSTAPATLQRGWNRPERDTGLQA